MFGMEIGKDSTIFLHCKFSSPWNIKLGDNVAISQYSYLDGRGGLFIGNNVNIGRSVSVFTGTHEYNKPGFDYVTHKVHIHDNVWIASNALLLPGVQLNEGCVIAAGAVVTKNIDAYTVVGGNPAKKIKERNRGLSYITKYIRFLS